MREILFNSKRIRVEEIEEKILNERIFTLYKEYTREVFYLVEEDGFEGDTRKLSSTELEDAKKEFNDIIKEIIETEI